MFSISSYSQRELLKWDQVGEGNQEILWIDLKKKKSKEPWRRVFQVFHHIEWTKITLYALVTQVSTWNIQSPWSFTMVRKHFHCYFWACFLATLHWCNSYRNWWELRTDIWKVKVLDRAVWTKKRKEPKITQCRKDMQQTVFFRRVFPAQFKCLLTVCS